MYEEPPDTGFSIRMICRLGKGLIARPLWDLHYLRRENVSTREKYHAKNILARKCSVYPLCTYIRHFYRFLLVATNIGINGLADE